MQRITILIAVFALIGTSALSCCEEEKEETNEQYCESVYWEDEDNCIYFEPGVFKGTPEFCNKIIWDSTRKACLKAIEEKPETDIKTGKDKR